jgi:hypothetical protein
VDEYTKKERAKLRELAGEAYERELGSHLAKLEESFAEWRRGKLLSSELSNEIHEFHQHAAREVWSSYQLPHPAMIVARAVAAGLLEESEIPEALRAKLEAEIAVFKRVKSAV